MNTSNGLRPLILARGLLSACLGLLKGSQNFAAAGFMWARKFAQLSAELDVFDFDFAASVGRSLVVKVKDYLYAITHQLVVTGARNRMD